MAAYSRLATLTSCRRRIHHSVRLTGLKEWFLGERKEELDDAKLNHSEVAAGSRVATESQEGPTIQGHLKTLAESIYHAEAEAPSLIENWTKLRISDAKIKTKVLISCEEAFNRSVPNKRLSSINTFGDLLQFYETPSKEPPGALFPNIRKNLSSLPPNLSVEFPPKQLPKLERKPFQNYNDPSHKVFPNKKTKSHKKWRQQ